MDVYSARPIFFFCILPVGPGYISHEIYLWIDTHRFISINYLVVFLALRGILKIRGGIRITLNPEARRSNREENRLLGHAVCPHFFRVIFFFQWLRLNNYLVGNIDLL